MTRKKLTDWPDQNCKCSTCKSMCDVSCWPTPEEAEDLIKRGYGPKLMLHSRLHPTETRDILVICPARRGCERKAVDYSSNKPCVFQNKEGLCELHGVCKPIEGRLAICNGPEPRNLRDRVAALWDNEKGREVVLRWIERFAKDKELHRKHSKLTKLYQVQKEQIEHGLLQD